MKTYNLYFRITPDNKGYIGLTTKDIMKRWNYGNGYRGRFKKAIDSYKDVIEHILFLDNLTKEDACRFEKLLIALFDTKNPIIGYNVASGGTGDGHSTETRLKIGLAVKGIKNGMYGVRRFGKDNPRYGLPSVNRGIPASDEVKLKISESRKGKCMLSDNPSARAVLCVTTNHEFKTMKEAGEYYNTRSSNICSACNGKLKTSGTFNGIKLEWKYI